MIEKFKESMMLEFDMTDLRMMHYFLDTEIMQYVGGFFIYQRKYVHDILNMCEMKNCNPATTPIEKGLKLAKNADGIRVASTLYKQLLEA